MRYVIALVTAALVALSCAPAALAHEDKQPAATKQPAAKDAKNSRKGVDDGVRPEVQNESAARGQRTPRHEDGPAARHPGGLIGTEWLIGNRVHDVEGRDIGRIEDLWFDPKDGRVKDVIVSVGAGLGVTGNDKLVAWKDLQIGWRDQKLFVTVAANALRDAREVQKDRDERGPAASPGSPPRR